MLKLIARIFSLFLAVMVIMIGAIEQGHPERPYLMAAFGLLALVIAILSLGKD